MSGAAIAQLIIMLAPLIKEVVIEGGKVVATYKSDISQEDINKALEASKSASWPDLDFGIK